MIVALAGRRIDAQDADVPRFPGSNTEWVAQALRQLFEREGATAVVCSAACGADLLGLREAGERGLRRRVVLPFDRAAFRASSVADRPGAWGPLFDTIVDDCASRGDVVTLGFTEGDRAYAEANLAILEQAQALGQDAGEPVCAVLAWDGVSRGEGDLTAAFGAAAAERGLPVLEVLTVKTCFVIQGFGDKPDLATGRVLNLDASYDVIKEAVQSAGLRCIRADEIIHAGSIDKVMYEWLFKAHLVIADLSTTNPNAVYELGVRYALRPYTTIIVAENQFKSPFDVNHQITRTYEHLGKDVGRQEARRLVNALASDIRTLMGQPNTDSPVYTFLPLQPPTERPRTPPRPQPAAPPAPRPGGAPGGSTAPSAPATLATAPPARAFDAAPLDESAKALLDRARAALDRNQFLEARGLLGALRVLRPRDPYITQQLALATYKSKSPDAVTALREAHAYLEELEPDTSNDPETIGLWGAVHKRLWDATGERAYLDRAIAAYERGFYLKQDYYNGVNFAFLLNVRADLFRREGNTAEATTDFVLARRMRRELIRYCDRALAAEELNTNARYWITATKWEAAVGLGDTELAQRFKRDAEALPVAPWMLDATRYQIMSLEKLLAAFGEVPTSPG